ncbi:hypothetical protein PR202_ga29518 [Eleusine coracana subsp. coracana]|uniref:Alpha 1,4-glycosyltransferase domain-containing protein n=1 Tax=Eleusine coracana subsp. coracana TaxID=191504 RepID=A0AAV5DN58_ELECO|nr:hypothetical protein PR202_ga29518 [Eleusine coracana subsp. coracana]
MLPRTHSHTARRRSGLGPQLCAAVAALLLLLSLAVLHSRLSSSSSSSSFPASRTRSSTPAAEANTSTLLADEEDVDVVAALDPLLTVTTTTTATTEGEGRSDAAEDVPASAAAAATSLVWDHAVGAARLPFRLPTAVDALPVGTPHLDAPRRIAVAVFGSDDELVDLDLRVEISSIVGVEDALLLKPASGGAETRLRAGWARWLEGKADYLRRDRMLRSNLESLNPRNHPLLQDPDSPGLTSLTRGDRMVQRMILAEIEKPANKNFEGRRLLSLENQQGMRVTAKKEQGKGRRWGHFPGIDPHLGFSEFLEMFFEHGKCSLKVFMIWSSPQWSYGVRHQCGLESLLKQHPGACVVMLSETLELEFFLDFVKEGYKVAVAVPNLDELLGSTPTHIFASVWYEWRKTKYYPLHYIFDNLLGLVDISQIENLSFQFSTMDSIARYGGVYIDSDVIVLKPLTSLWNSIGAVKQVSGNYSFSGAVLAFEKQRVSHFNSTGCSPLLEECLKEFYSSYDDTLLQWNGAELMTRVISNLSSKADESMEHLDVNLEPSVTYFPISATDIERFIVMPPGPLEPRIRAGILQNRVIASVAVATYWAVVSTVRLPHVATNRWEFMAANMKKEYNRGRTLSFIVDSEAYSLIDLEKDIASEFTWGNNQQANFWILIEGSMSCKLASDAQLLDLLRASRMVKLLMVVGSCEHNATEEEMPAAVNIGEEMPAAMNMGEGEMGMSAALSMGEEVMSAAAAAVDNDLEVLGGGFAWAEQPEYGKTTVGPPITKEEEEHFIIVGYDPNGDEPAGVDEEWRYFKSVDHVITDEVENLKVEVQKRKRARHVTKIRDFDTEIVPNDEATMLHE